MRQRTNAFSHLDERIIIILILFLALFLRMWVIDRIGLSYDEAATALMSRATPLEIVQFHWTAGFEHPPLWVLTMNLWARGFGQSELAIRLLPILAGVLVLPIFWHFLRRAVGMTPLWRMVALLLLATSPVLIEYSRIGRMYTVVTLLAMINLYAYWHLIQRSQWKAAAIFVVSSWLMHGYHFYSGLLLLPQGAIALALLLFYQQKRSQSIAIFGLLLLASIPLVLWLLFAPGFAKTAEVILSSTNGARAWWQVNFYGLWHELIYSFTENAAGQQTTSYLLLSVLAIGFVGLLWFRSSKKESSAIPLSHLLIAATLTIPVAFSLFQFGAIKTRYILYVTLPIYIAISFGMAQLSRLTILLGIASIGLVGWIHSVGIHNALFIKQTIEYRELAAHLTRQMDEADGILLNGPRQHILTRYYLDEAAVDNAVSESGVPIDLDAVYPMPQVELPAYWPITAPPIVPEDVDDLLQSYLRKHENVWLILSGQGEVDPNEFVAKYLSTVAYEKDCSDWYRVRLCNYHSPFLVDLEQSQTVNARFGEELLLKAVHLTLAPARPGGSEYLLARFDWLTLSQPATNYKVTMRLLDSQDNQIAQRDLFPNGDLILPTMWQVGEERPGQMVLELPLGIAPGSYKFFAGLYDPQNPVNIPYTKADGTLVDGLLHIANLKIGESGNEIVLEQGNH